jgi:hypothetical protein
MGTCSRLYKLSHIWLNQIEECYHFLYNWSLCFPSGFKQKEENKFLLSNNLHCEQDTLKAARSTFAQQMKNLKRSNQHKIHLETYIANPITIDKVQELKTDDIPSPNDLIEENNDIMDFEDLGGN